MDVAIALSGGGARGAFEAGVLAALADVGLRPRVLSGTSAGALNAAAIAAGLDAEELVAVWRSLESRDVYRVRKDVHRLLRPWHLISHPRRLLGLGPYTSSAHLLESIGWNWLLDMAPLRDRLVDLLGTDRVGVADDRVLTVSCVNVGTGELVRFTNRPPADDDGFVTTEMTIDHVLASAAIPGLFRPVVIDGHAYWDGGLVANTPLRTALDYQPEVLFVVATGAVDRRVTRPVSLGGTVALMVDHIMRFAMVADLEYADSINALIRSAPGAAGTDPTRIVPIVPDESGIGIGRLLDFEPEVAARQIAMGRRAAREALDRAQLTA